MESYIAQKTGDGQQPGNGRATFRDLVEKYADLHFKRLYVFGTNLTQQAVRPSEPSFYDFRGYALGRSPHEEKPICREVKDLPHTGRPSRG